MKVIARQALLKVAFGPQALVRAKASRSRREQQANGEIKRILVIRPDHLGDLLFATAALARLRQAFPGAHISGMVGSWGRAMWEHDPDIDSLQVTPFPGIASREGGLKPYRLLGKAAGKLAQGEYDLAIVLRFDHWWGAALTWLAGIPRRWGYDTAGMSSWLTNSVRYTAGRHEVEQDLYLVEEIIRAMPDDMGVEQLAELMIDRRQGEPALRPPHRDRPPDEVLGEWLSASRRVIIHPGTAAANKLWTISGWAHVASKLSEEGWAVAITGSPDERPLAKAIMRTLEVSKGIGMIPALNIAGQTRSIGQLAWILEHAHMVLGVDSGPLHIADALLMPTLHLYGPSDERIWGPWGDPEKHRALRAPGTSPTMRLDVLSRELEGGPEMRALTPEMVLSEIDRLTINTP